MIDEDFALSLEPLTPAEIERVTRAAHSMIAANAARALARKIAHAARIPDAAEARRRIVRIRLFDPRDPLIFEERGGDAYRLS